MKKRPAKPHQKKVLAWAKGRTRVALFLEMRLGKTLVAIRWLEEQKAKRVLFVTKKSAIPPLVEEFRKEGYGTKDYMVLEGTHEERLNKANFGQRWNIVNYEGILACPELVAIPWDGIVLDESTKIRNPQAQITKLLQLAAFIRNRAIMTGYPNPESSLDYFEQMRFLFDGRFMGFNNYWSWRNTHCIQVGYDWILRKNSEKQLQDEIAQYAYVLSRKDAGLKTEKIYERLYVEPNEKQLKLTETITRDFEFTSKGNLVTTKWVPVKLGWLQQVAGGFTPDREVISQDKVLEILDLLRGDLKREKVVIWFKHTHELDMVYDLLNAKKIVAVKFNAEDQTRIKEFTHGKAQVVCAQAKCGQMGLDWSVSSTAIYYSNWWDNEIRKQTEDRIVSMNKKEPLLYIDLITKDSIDEDVLDILKMKNFVGKKFLNELVKRIFP